MGRGESARRVQARHRRTRVAVSQAVSAVLHALFLVPLVFSLPMACEPDEETATLLVELVPDEAEPEREVDSHLRSDRAEEVESATSAERVRTDPVRTAARTDGTAREMPAEATRTTPTEAVRAELARTRADEAPPVATVVPVDRPTHRTVELPPEVAQGSLADDAPQMAQTKGDVKREAALPEPEMRPVPESVDATPDAAARLEDRGEVADVLPAAGSEHAEVASAEPVADVPAGSVDAAMDDAVAVVARPPAERRAGAGLIPGRSKWVRRLLPGVPRFDELKKRRPVPARQSDADVWMTTQVVVASAGGAVPLAAVGLSRVRPVLQPVPEVEPTQASPASTPGNSSANAYPSAGAQEVIEGLATADETAADTQRDLLYAYLLRVREAVEPLWSPVAILRQAGAETQQLSNRGVVELHVFLRLTADGELDEVRLERPSGIPRLDEHAMESVVRAAPFLPPPTGLLDEDGMVGFTYGARVRVR